MSTRRMKRTGTPRQERFASSPAHLRGLLGNLVARRCSRVHSEQTRELIYFLADISWRDPSLRHPSCTSFAAWPWQSTGPVAETAFARLSRELCAQSAPADAEAVASQLPAFFERLCLDPAFDPELANVPFFPSVLAELGKYKARFERAAAARVAQTETTRAVWELLDYASEQTGLVLGEGAYRTGKSISAQAWAQSHLGRCRYVQLTSSKDEHSFYSSIARSLGIACGQTMKAAQIRPRIEDTLREQHLLLIIDEADWLWPQAVRLRETPSRVIWLLTAIVNAGVPVALIGSRNFSRLLVNTERRCPIWGSEQFYGRLRRRATLPEKLSTPDLFAIAKITLPEADADTRTLLVGHSLKTPAPVPAIESAAARARYFARLAGREAVAFDDMEAVLIEAGSLPAQKPAPAPARIRPTPAVVAATPPALRGRAANTPRQLRTNFVTNRPESPD